MQIFGMEKMSLVDYDENICCTLFTAGCNFRCGFCHNGPLVVDTKNLSPLDTNQILDYISSRKNLLDAVCVSGGEPTLFNDLPDFIKKIKELGLKVKLDTNGTNPNMIKLLHQKGLVDFFAMDIKSDLDGYGKIIGVENFDTNNVKASVEYLISNCKNYEFRTTLIKEFHTPQVMENIGKWIKGANKYRLQKFKETDGCIEHGLTKIEEDIAKKYVDILRPYVINTDLRGYWFD